MEKFNFATCSGLEVMVFKKDSLLGLKFHVSTFKIEKMYIDRGCTQAGKTVFLRKTFLRLSFSYEFPKFHSPIWQGSFH